MRILILVLFLAGCGAPMKKPEFNRVNVVTVEINNDIGYNSKGKRINGQARWGNGRCHLKLPEIQDLNDRHNMATWGHELMHCVYGDFHE